MKKWLVSALALGLCSAAYAQISGDDPERQRQLRESTEGFGFRFGVYLPTDDEVKDQDSSLIALGLEYRLEKPWFAGGDTYLELDFMTGDWDAWAFTLNQRFFTGTSPFGGFGKRAYFYVGLGGLWVDDVGADMAFALRGGLGLEMGRHAFLEGGVLLADDVDSVNPSGVQIAIGFRY